MLTAEPHVPHIQTAEVCGVDGSKALLALADDELACDLWAQSADRRAMACVRLDLAGWQALQALAAEMVRRLAPKDTNGPDH